MCFFINYGCFIEIVALVRVSGGRDARVGCGCGRFAEGIQGVAARKTRRAVTMCFFIKHGCFIELVALVR
eukprot:9490963-Pyramimonas_sp.AAC.2